MDWLTIIAMNWETAIAIGVISLLLVVIALAVLCKFYGAMVMRYFVVGLGCVIMGGYIGAKAFWVETRPYHCGPGTVGEYNRHVVFFSQDMAMGTGIDDENDFYEAPYPEYLITELHVVDYQGVVRVVDGTPVPAPGWVWWTIEELRGKLLCVDGHPGQLLLTTMVEGCNAE